MIFSLVFCQTKTKNPNKLEFFKDIDKNNEHFSKLVDASINYALPPIINKINAGLDKVPEDYHRQLRAIPPSGDHSTFGWFGTKRHEVPWSSVQADIVRGERNYFRSYELRIRTAMSMRTTYNAVTIGVIAASRGKQQ